MFIDIRPIVRHGNEKPASLFHQVAYGKRRIEQLFFRKVHEDRRAEDSIKFAAKRLAKIWQHTYINFCLQFGIFFLSILDHLWRSINPIYVYTVLGEYSHITAGTTANVKYLHAFNKHCGEIFLQTARNIVVFVRYVFCFFGIIS